MIWTIIYILVTIILLIAAFIYGLSIFYSYRYGELEKFGFVSAPIKGKFSGSKGNRTLFQSLSEDYQQFKHLKAYASYVTRFPWITVASLDMAKDILVKNFNQFPTRHTFPMTSRYKDTGFGSPNVEDWKHVRRNTSPVFSTSRIKHMSKRVEQKAEEFVESLVQKQESGEPVELRESASIFTVDAIASTGFGMDVNSIKDPNNVFMQKSKKLVDNFFKLFFYEALIPFVWYLPKSLFGEMMNSEVSSYFENFVTQAIEMRKKQDDRVKKTPDFVQMIVDTENQKQLDLDGLHENDRELQLSTDRRGLTHHQMLGMTAAFFIGSYDTVSSALSMTLFCIAMHPEILAKVQEEIDEVHCGAVPNYESVQKLTYLEMCISETLRLFPPGFMNERECAQTTELHGFVIPKGQKVVVPVWAIHRDPEIYPEPEKFDPERFSPENKTSRHPCAYMPWGFGPRICIGMRLAQLEIRTVLAFILQRLSPVSCSQSVWPIPMHDYRLISTKGLWVKFESRSKD